MRSLPANIRFISSNDYKQIDTIDDSIEHPSLSNSKSIDDELRCDRNIKCYVVEHDGIVVAYAVIKNHNNYIELRNISVDRRHRRHKIASFLMDMLKIQIKLEQKDYIISTVSEYNLSAQLFLRTNEFRAATIMRNYYADGHSAYLMTFKQR
jgi:ribosomal protein S18 acetylase RimI-like enzyme